MDINTIRTQVAAAFPVFGPNKRQEIERLIFEITKREGLPAEMVLGAVLREKGFDAIKDALVRRRFPDLIQRGIKVSEAFSAVDIDPDSRLEPQTPPPFSPRAIYVEKGEEGSALARRFRSAFPSARFELIASYKDAAAGRTFSVRDYNQRSQSVFIVRERFDRVRACPCSPEAVSCGYHNINLGFGCPYECSYCFLQNYTNAPGIVLPSNIKDILGALESCGQGVRIGSGETTDSLVFDHLTGFSPIIVEHFRKRPESLFEFKTKSANGDLLLSVPAASNIVAAWSVNPPSVVAGEEHGTASLEERLEAARRCAGHGYRTAFHFDPIIHYPAWEADYSEVVRMIFAKVPKESIAWISLGTLRMTARQKKIIENRFPENTILDAELLTAPDGKVRYHDSLRREMYQAMLSAIRAHSTDTLVYLCMETPEIWGDLGLKVDWS